MSTQILNLRTFSCEFRSEEFIALHLKGFDIITRLYHSFIGVKYG